MIELDANLPAELVPLSWLIGQWEGTGVVNYEVDGEERTYEFGQRISFTHDGLPHLNYTSYTWLLDSAGTPAGVSDGASSSNSDSGSSDGLPGESVAADGAPTGGGVDVKPAGRAYTAVERSGEAEASGAEAVDSDSTAGQQAGALRDENGLATLRPLATETGYWRLSRPATEGDPGPGLLPGFGLQPFTTARAVETLRNAAGGFDIEATIVHPGGVSELYVGQVKGPRIDLVTDAVMRSANSKEHAASTRLYGLVENHMLWAWDIAALGHELRSHASGRLAHGE